MKPVLRWVLVAVLLTSALVVALWSRPSPSAAPAPRAAAQLDGPAQPAAGPASLEQLRSRAALQPCPAAHLGVRGPLSGIVLPCLGQPGTLDVGAALAGRPALLNLWSPLCQPCVQELPALAGYAAEPGAVRVLGVDVQGPPEAALEALAALHVHYPSVTDPDGRLRAALRAPPVVPLSYLVSADGRISQVNPPEVLRTPQQVRTLVARYLGPGAAG